MKKIVVLTGAGISAESGISTFRDSNGLWEQYKVEDVASIEGYYRNPKLVIDFYNHLRRNLGNAQPNRAHQLLVELEKHFDVTVVTQNVDDLHERAGSKHIIHLHGELRKATSSNNPNNKRCIVKLPHFDSDIHMGDKAADGSQLRPFIVWFGEAVPEMDPAIQATLQADIFIIVGTSLNVYPAAGLVRYVKQGVPIFLIDPKQVKMDSGIPVEVIQKGASEGMSILMPRLLDLAD